MNENASKFSVYHSKFNYEEEFENKNSSGSFIFMSLYLFIMIFFILMTSVTKPQKNKQSQAILSVSKQFSNDNSLIPPSFSNEITQIAELKIINSVKKILPKNFKSKNQSAYSQELIQVSSSQDKFFRKNKSQFRITQVDFLKNFVQIIDESPIKVDLELNIDSNFSSDKVLNSKRISNLASHLIDQENLNHESLIIKISDSRRNEINLSLISNSNF